MVSMAEPPRNDPDATHATPLASVRASDTDGDARTEAAPLEGPAAPPAPAPRTVQATAPLDEGPPVIAGRYEILGMLGSGGMGTVYRARDRELDEEVALKVLKKELASAGGMIERFRREVKLARRVTHRNVARTFDIGEHAGDRFLTMELVEGEMLGALLARRGRVSLREVIAIGRDVCAGLDAAHAAGVLHRDLKPENVILARDGRAVITDFGIARAVTQGELARTGPGMIGTPAYMAPEQVEGSVDLDGRADLYALGAMIFELLTGVVAWPGDSVIAIAAGRILRPPPSVRAHVPELSEEVASVVLKLMARSRDDRYESAGEAGAALAELETRITPSARSLAPASLAESRAARGIATTTSPRGPRKTVAVLPLLNLGADDDAYLAQTVTEDLVDLLSVVPELRLRPRGQTARFDTKTRDVREAGRELGVDVVVDGSLRRVDAVVRVSVRLVTVEDGFQLWARRFDRAPAAVLSVADDAAAAVAHALATELTTEARPSAVGDAIAQDLYLRGRYLVHRGWFESSREGAAMLKQAYERAPDDTRIAGAYALATARVLAAGEYAQGLAAEARELAERTLERDPKQAEARLALGFVHLNASEGAAAAVELKRALAVAPNSVEALDATGRLLIESGRTDLGLRMLRKALAIEPGMSQPRLTMVRAHALLGDLDAARELLGPVPTNRTDFTPYMLTRARVAAWRRDHAELDELLALVEPSDLLTDFGKQSILGLVGVAKTGTLGDAVRARVDTGLTLDGRYASRRTSFHAQMRTELKLSGGDMEGALVDLRVGDANGLLDLLWLDRCPLFDPVRGRPELVSVRASVAGRAERVIAILDP
jgi:eukaryotic-like serine/threonine-protein kinase